MMNIRPQRVSVLSIMQISFAGFLIKYGAALPVRGQQQQEQNLRREQSSGSPVTMHIDFLQGMFGGNNQNRGSGGSGSGGLGSGSSFDPASCALYQQAYNGYCGDNANSATQRMLCANLRQNLESCGGGGGQSGGGGLFGGWGQSRRSDHGAARRGQRGGELILGNRFWQSFDGSVQKDNSTGFRNVPFLPPILNDFTKTRVNQTDFGLWGVQKKERKGVGNFFQRESSSGFDWINGEFGKKKQWSVPIVGITGGKNDQVKMDGILNPGNLLRMMNNILG